MTTFLVTRHEGTRLWASAMVKHGRLPFTIDRMVDHLDPESLKKGDVVVGTLPIHVAADLRARGIEFWSLDLQLPPADRGKELSGVYLAKCGARFTRYEVRRKESADVAAKSPQKAPKAQPGITVIAVSGELAPAAIGWLHQPTPTVCLLASPAMKDKAKTLKQWLLARANAPKVAIVAWDDRDYSTLLVEAEGLAADLALEERPEVVINLTGGTKPMAMALQRAFGKRSESFRNRLHGAYVDTTHRRIEEMLAPEPIATPMRSVLNLADLLALQGLKVESAASASASYGDWLGREKFFNLLTSKRANSWLPTWYALLDIADWLVNPRRNNKQQRVFKNDLATVEWNGKTKEPTLTYTIHPSKRHNWKGFRAALKGELGIALDTVDGTSVSSEGENGLTIKLDRSTRDELAFLAGGWMEVWLAAKVMKLGADDWAQGITVLKDGVKNELDLLVAAGNRLLLVEVKTGNLNRDGKEDSKATEAVYKLDAVAERLGRYFNDRWLVSLKNLDYPDLERAKNHRIRVFSGGGTADVPGALKDWIKASHLERDEAFSVAQLPPPQ